MLHVEEMEGIERGIVYGCGNWGRKCVSYMEGAGIPIEGCCDSNPERWGEEFEGYPVIPPEELPRDASVIVAIERPGELVGRLLDGGLKVGFFYEIFDERDIYRVTSARGLLGCNTGEELKKALGEYGRIGLAGGEKRREDFKYIFDWLPFYEEYEGMEEAAGRTARGEGNICSEGGCSLYIVCEKDAGAIRERFAKDDFSIIGADELFCLLGEEGETDCQAAVWMRKTFYGEQEEQPSCIQPFTSAKINSDFELHCCCADWSMAWGSILEGRSLEELWKSDLARIFRLSLINRTYSFCNRERCVLLKSHPKKRKMERLAAGIKAASVPLYLEIGIDRTCNLYCKSCRDCVIVEQGGRKEKIEKAKEIIMKSSWAEKSKVLLLGGQGEVFASRPYQEIMLGFEGRRESLSLRSNGVLLDEEWFLRLKEKYEKLQIIISVDAAKKETYDVLRRSHDRHAWDKLRENLRMLSEKRRTGDLDFFQLNMCVQRDNYKEMSDFVRMGHELGADKVYLTPIRNWGTYTDEEFREIRIFDDGKRVKEEVREELEKVRALSVKPVIEIAFE